jgi:hypothetical protein
MRPSTSVIRLASIAAVACAMVAPAFSQHRDIDNNPDILEMRHYRLTMEKVQKVADATDAVNKMLAADPALKKRVDAQTDTDNNQTIDAKARDMDARFPQIAAVVHSHGITTREYIVISMAFINDVTAVAMKRQGAIKDYPAGMITPENAAFVEQNYDKLQELGKRMTPQDQGDQN